MSTRKNNQFSLIIGALCFLFSLSLNGQTKVNASEILAQIERGESVRYSNVVIEGVLDMTKMEEKLPSLNRYRGVGNNSIEEDIKGSLSFEDCVFEEEVIAYFHDEPSGYTFIAHFNEDVRFTTCTFQKGAFFKYSEFVGLADFNGSTFREESNFKYAKFEGDVGFSNVVFREEGNFKYAKFREYADFKETLFKSSGNFKYSKFMDQIDFSNCRFNDVGDFKYAEFKRGAIFRNASFDHIDMKYTNIKGDFDYSGLVYSQDADTKYMKWNQRDFSFGKNYRPSGRKEL